jgi:uncharacterized membrane protein YesL
MIAAASVLRWAVAGLYDESVLFLKVNLAWFLLSLPLGSPLLLLLAGFLPAGEDGRSDWVLPGLLIGLLLLLVPNPASLGVYRVAAIMDRRESPPWTEFWQATRQNVGLGLALFGIGLFGTILLVFNLGFYLGLENNPLQAASIVWVYLTLFWLGMQLYLGPLVLLVGERRLPSLYRRSAMLVLAQPIYTLTFLLAIGLLLLLCVLAWPVYPLLAMGFVALTGTCGLSRLRRRYDPTYEPGEDEL